MSSRGAATSAAPNDPPSVEHQPAECALVARPIELCATVLDDDEFDEAMVEFALAYAEQNEADYAAFTRAVNTGRLFAIPGV